MATPEHGGAALAWLAHPASLLALAALIVNDHVLKPVWPGVLTGKLSDVAGLLIAPPLLALIGSAFGRGFRATAVVALAITGTGFTLVKISEYAASMASDAWTAVAGPSRVLADPTDLLALPALLLAYHIGMRAGREPAPGRVARMVRTGLILPVAALGVAATSYDEPRGADRAVAYQGQIWVAIGIEYYSTVDGENWHRTDDREWHALYEDRQFQAEMQRSGGSVWSPRDPGHQYRPIAGRLGVEEHTTGDWQPIWQLSPGRQEYLGREYGEPVGTKAVAVLGTGSRRLLVAANGLDGIAVRVGDGPFERVGFPREPYRPYSTGSPGSPSPSPAPPYTAGYPTPLDSGGGNIGPEICLALLLGLGCVTLGTRWPATYGQAVGLRLGEAGTALAVGLFWAGAAQQLDPLLTTLVGLGIVVVAGVALVTTYAVYDGLTGPGKALLLLAGVVAGALFILPFQLWSRAYVDELSTAYALALPAVAVGLIAAWWIGRRWRRPWPLTAPAADPSPAGPPPTPSTEDLP